jgi:hypothetical protein
MYGQSIKKMETDCEKFEEKLVEWLLVLFKSEIFMTYDDKQDISNYIVLSISPYAFW